MARVIGVLVERLALFSRALRRLSARGFVLRDASLVASLERHLRDRLAFLDAGTSSGSWHQPKASGE
jgi:hypothetical protein